MEKYLKFSFILLNAFNNILSILREVFHILRVNSREIFRNILVILKGNKGRLALVYLQRCLKLMAGKWVKIPSIFFTVLKEIQRYFHRISKPFPAGVCTKVCTKNCTILSHFLPHFLLVSAPFSSIFQSIFAPISISFCIIFKPFLA